MIDDEIDTSFSDEQLAKKLSPISVIVDGIEISVNFLQSRKELESILISGLDNKR